MGRGLLGGAGMFGAWQKGAGRDGEGLVWRVRWVQDEAGHG